MHNLADIIDAATDPRIVLRELNQYCHTWFGLRKYNPKGTSIFDETWDNLIILDACRYDTFAEVSSFSGPLDYRYSLGSATPEFIRGNFTDRTLHDIVYVTANSWYLNLHTEINAEIHELFDLHSHPNNRYSHEEFDIVMPDTLTDRAIDVASKYPNKRLIIHYIQPHHPFIGPIGREQFQHSHNSLEKVVRWNDAPTDVVRKAYRENLEIVLSSLRDLLPELQGATAITADHGEMLGERFEFFPIRGFGHPGKIWNELLTKVPWYVIENGPRKEILPEAPNKKAHSVGEVDVHERLQQLGYKT